MITDKLQLVSRRSPIAAAPWQYATNRLPGIPISSTTLSHHISPPWRNGCRSAQALVYEGRHPATRPALCRRISMKRKSGRDNYGRNSLFFCLTPITTSRRLLVFKDVVVVPYPAVACKWDAFRGIAVTTTCHRAHHSAQLLKIASQAGAILTFSLWWQANGGCICYLTGFSFARLLMQPLPCTNPHVLKQPYTVSLMSAPVLTACNTSFAEAYLVWRASFRLSARL